LILPSVCYNRFVPGMGGSGATTEDYFPSRA
jgi:hypothetical protein